MAKRVRKLTRKERAEKGRTVGASHTPPAAKDDRAWVPAFLELFSRIPYDSRNAEAARLLKFQNLPRSLFKFSSVSDECLENLAKGQVWMTPPSEMNDPFDATFRHSPAELFRPLVNEQFARIIESGEAGELNLTPDEWARVRSSDDLLAAVTRIGLEKSGEIANADNLIAALSTFTERFLGSRIEAISAAFQAHYMVSCFCERVDSPLLWGHYAANHRGMCVEYPIRGAVSDAHVQSRLLFPVIYSDKRFDATKHLASGFAGDLMSSMTTGILSAIHKFSDWAYEREWRLVDPGALMKPGPAKMPAPIAVYCGVRLADAEKARLLRAAAAVRVPVYQMTPDRETFRMMVVGPIQDADGAPRPIPKDAWELATEQMEAAGTQAAAGVL